MSGFCSAHILEDPYCGVCHHPSCEGTHALVAPDDPVLRRVCEAKRLDDQMFNHMVTTGRLNIDWITRRLCR